MKIEDNLYLQTILYKNQNNTFSYKLINTLVGFLNSFSFYNLKVNREYRNGMMTQEAFINIYWLLKSTLTMVEGDILEIGCHEGLTAVLLSKILENEHSKKQIYLYDSFEGLEKFSEKDEGCFMEVGDCQSTFNSLRNNFISNNLKLPKIVVGKIEETIPRKLPKKISFLHLDVDLYSSTKHALKHVMPLLSKGAIVILDDFGNPSIPGVELAVKETATIKKRADKIITLEAGEYPMLSGKRPNVNGTQILRKYQSYFQVIK